jgi:hypothetical protein
MMLAAASTEYIRVPVTATEAGEPVDITGDTVALGFTDSWNSDAPAEWHPATWETINDVHTARLLIGPGTDVALTAGAWDVWVKVTDNPETPVLKAGVLRIY